MYAGGWNAALLPAPISELTRFQQVRGYVGRLRFIVRDRPSIFGLLSASRKMYAFSKRLQGIGILWVHRLNSKKSFPSLGELLGNYTISLAPRR